MCDKNVSQGKLCGGNWLDLYCLYEVKAHQENTCSENEGSTKGDVHRSGRKRNRVIHDKVE